MALASMPCLVAAQATPQAAAAFVDRSIATISVTIEGRPTAEPALLEALQTKTGAPLKMAEVRETITHLYSLGRFADVRVDAEPAAAGVALRYDLTPIHTVTKVEFRGQLGLSESALRRRMSERFGDTPTVTRASEVAAFLQEFYAEEGYLDARVTAADPTIFHEPDRATLEFDVASGARTVIGRSAVTGEPLEPAAQIRRRLQIEPGQPYRPGELRTRLDALTTAMRHRRYYQAAATLVTPVFTPDRASVDVTVNVDPGPLVAVQFTGDPLPKEKIAELVPIEREGSADEDLLEDSARRITDYLRQQGYWKAEVNPPERREADGRLTIIFHVARGRIYHVAPSGVDVTGNRAISIEELKPLLKLAPGELFVASRMTAIEGAIEQVYKTRGFAALQLTSAVNDIGSGLVRPVIAIQEGPRVVVGQVAIAGNTSVPGERLRPVLSIASGQPYYGPAVARDRDALTAFYLDEGYAAADVTVAPVSPVVAGDTARADITFKVVEGPQTVVEHIFITGNLRTNPAVIERELQIQAGKPLGQAALNDTRRRLSSLGLFRRIQISVVSHGDPRLRDVVVAVEEAQQTTIGYGGGLQIDRILRSDSGATAKERYEFAPRGFFEVGRRNLGGRNRSINLYSRLSLRPNSDLTSTNQFGFSEYRIVGTYREPKAFGGSGDLTATAAVEQGVRTGFNFSRKGFNGELAHRLTPTIRGSARYSFSTTRIFDNRLADNELDELTVDRVFPQVRLSSVSVAASRDSRDDPLEPQRGTLLTADGTIAARLLGSEVGFTKGFVQGFVYRNLGRPHFVFAGGARLGLARAFVRLVETTVNGNPETVAVRDLPASERFFVGGDTTIRGYALDSVGVPATITPTGFPRGGDAEVVFNAELRAPVLGDFGAAFFIDGGNVFARAADLDLTQLRGSVGLGARYRSPIGPIRLDIGFKLDRRRIGLELESRYAIHFSIGQAF